VEAAGVEKGFVGTNRRASRRILTSLGITGETMDHKEQHHEHHRHEREEHKKEQHQHEQQQMKKSSLPVPLWVIILGFVLTLGAVLVWVFAVP
jgi:ABC-type nickel/cobalt efflux system permease component RcnA